MVDKRGPANLLGAALGFAVLLVCLPGGAGVGPGRARPMSALAAPAATPIRSIPNLTGITFWESSGAGPEAYSFAVNSPELTIRLADPLVGGSNDDFGPVEPYDVFYSNADGTFNPDGEYVTVEAVWMETLPRGGGLNICEVQLSFSNRPDEHANSVATFVGLGDNYVAGSEANAVDNSRMTCTAMGNTVGQPPGTRLRVTVGFPRGLRITKTDHGIAWSGGQGLRYDITVTNTGGQREVGLILFDRVPSDGDFLPEQSDPGWICEPSDLDRQQCRLTLGDLDAGASRTVALAIVIQGNQSLFRDIWNQVELNDDTGLIATAQDCTIYKDCEGAALACCFLLFLTGDATICSGPGPFSIRPAAAAQEELDLFLLYRVRGRVFGRTPGGRRLTDLYYSLTPDLIEAAMADPSIVGMARGALLAWQPHLRALADGRGATAVVTAQQVSDLIALLSAFKAAGSAELRALIEEEEARFDLPSLPGKSIEELHRRLDRQPCVPSESVLCLNDGRFRVETAWRRADGTSGSGHAAALTEDSGYFWFFNSANVELIAKALDGCGVNGHFWAFLAGLTNVEVTTWVTDTTTGEVRTYFNPLGRAFPPELDTEAFAACSTAPASRPPRTGGPADAVAAPRLPPGCVPGGTTLCLEGGRFRVQASWETATGASGVAGAVPLTEDSGYFWFFDPNNVEMLVKVLDGCAVNGSRWVFAGGLTNVRVELTVTDTQTGDVRTYVNPVQTPFAPIQDTAAFPGCSSGLTFGRRESP